MGESASVNEPGGSKLKPGTDLGLVSLTARRRNKVFATPKRARADTKEAQGGGVQGVEKETGQKHL